MNNAKDMASMDRAIELLGLAGAVLREYAPEATIFYDGVNCDGLCLADDCVGAAVQLQSCKDGRAHSKRWSAKMIINAVARMFAVSPSDITGVRRSETETIPRHVTFLLLREQARTLTEIGRLVGWKDHSSVFHGIASIKRRAAKHDHINIKIALLRAEIMDKSE